jgi:uncharacterized Zn finger protein
VDELRSSVHITYACKGCGTANEIIATDLSGNELVNCSGCGAVLGTVHELSEVAIPPLRELLETDKCP